MYKCNIRDAVLVFLSVLYTNCLPIKATPVDPVIEAPSQVSHSNSTLNNNSSSQPSQAVTTPNPLAVPKMPTPKPAFKIGSRFSRTVQKVTGINWISSVIASQVTKTIIHHELGGKVHVKIRTYSLTDLLAGKIKSADVSLNDCKLKKMPLGKVRLTTANPLWVSFRKKNGIRGLRTPVLVAIQAKLSQKDVGKALQSKQIVSSLRGLKLDLPGLGSQQLQIVDPKVELETDLIKIEAILVTEGANEETGVPITLWAKPKLLGNARIVLTDLRVSSPDIVEPEKFAAFAQELLNPVFDFCKLDRGSHAFRMTDMQIANDVVEGAGSLLLAPKLPRTNLVQQGSIK